MPKVTFTGYVTPSGFIKQAGRGPLLPQDAELPGLSITYAITDSRFVADCQLQSADPDSFTRAHLWVYHLVRENLDIVSFTQGVGLTLIVENCTLPNGEMLPVHMIDRSLVPLCTIPIKDILEIVELDRRILKHIHDLAYTLSHPLEIAVNCGRAIEGVSRLVCEESEPKKRWGALRENLNLNREYVQMITDLSTDPRHGGIEAVSLTRLDEVKARSWTIVNRFLHFKKGGSVRLPITEFPLL